MSAAKKHVNQGHPTIKELIVEQDVVLPRDPRGLLGDFWAEEESIDDFIRAMREWRGHRNTDPAATPPFVGGSQDLAYATDYRAKSI